MFHFEGKMWRTIPELFFHPGRLTRRYIDGERAKFVSPMALYLFTVFLMFGVFSFTTSNIFDSTKDSVAGDVVEQWKENNQAAKEKTDDKIAAVQEQLKDKDLSPREARGARAQPERSAVGADSHGRAGERRLGRAQEPRDERAGEAGDRGSESEGERRASKSGTTSSVHSDIGWPALQQRVERGARELKDNPSLAFYKLKIASYKYSWALIPLSVPFMWLLFFWRRDIHLYDHAIFITYSISFMMTFLILLTLAAAFGVSGAIWGTALGIVPPLHLYKQLRYAYGLSRFGALLRLFLLSIAISIVLMIFFVLLLMIGMIG